MLLVADKIHALKLELRRTNKLLGSNFIRILPDTCYHIGNDVANQIPFNTVHFQYTSVIYDLNQQC